jgi:hypothetical protein
MFVSGLDIHGEGVEVMDISVMMMMKRWRVQAKTAMKHGDETWLCLYRIEDILN